MNEATQIITRLDRMMAECEGARRRYKFTDLLIRIVVGVCFVILWEISGVWHKPIPISGATQEVSTLCTHQ